MSARPPASLLLLALSLGVVCGWSGTALAQAPDATTTRGGKRALLIAIASYPPGGYRTLSGPLNDTTLVAGALRRHGFEVDAITDADATREGIGAAFDRLATATRPGDAVLVHYSGHGRQVTDASGDEPDGYDEALVPYDAPYDAPASAADLAGAFLLDDDLGAALRRLRAAAGPRGEVLLSLDACHSGTGYRGPLAVRGDEPLGAPGDRSGGARSGPASVDGMGAGAGLAPFVFFSAGGEEQPVTEVRHGGQVVGPLSLALSEALTELSDGETYRALAERVRRGVAQRRPELTAQAEGDLDRTVLGGRAVAQTPFVRVLEPQGGAVAVDAGTAAGLGIGSVVAFHPAGTSVPEGDPLASGTVEEAGPFYAVVRLEPGGPDDYELLDAWGFVTFRALGDARLDVRLDPDLPDADRLRALLRQRGLVREVDETDEEDVRVESDGSRLIARDVATGSILLDTAATAVGRFVLAEALGERARARYLRQIRLDDPLLDVRLTAHALAPGLDGPYCTVDPAGVGAQPLRSLGPGAFYALRVTNLSAARVWVAALSLPSTGEVVRLFPLDNQADHYVDPGQSRLLDVCYRADEGATPGADHVTIKVFAADADFDPAVFDGAARSADPLGRVLADLSADAASLDRRATPLGAPQSAETADLVLPITLSDAP